MTDTRIVSRRGLFAGRVKAKTHLPSPPGTSPASLGACTGCAACAPVCPTHIIVMEESKPRLNFAKGECVFCGACAEACPEPVFVAARPLTFDHVVQISDSCLAIRGISCMACRDACPSDAIRFRPRIGGPFTPEIVEMSCTGCGACIAPCPVNAIGITHRVAEASNA